MQLIETKTLGTAAASIEFTSIPQDGTDLVALISGRSTVGGVVDILFIRPNGSSTNLSRRILQGSGSAAASATASDVDVLLNASGSTSNTFSSSTVYIANYAGNANKSISADSVMENNATESYQRIVAGLWSDVSAITSLTFIIGGGTLVVGTSISLYKVTKGSGGATVS
jgi:hypothetical protein